MDESMDVLALLGLWLYVAIQFGKGKAWSEKLTIYLSLGLPFILGAVVVFAPPQFVEYAQATARLFLYGIGFWAVNKASNKESNGN